MYFPWFRICFLILLFLPCQSAFAAERTSVFVSILPQKYFIEKIGGDLIDISVMVQPGASPATYEPRPSQMAALAHAGFYFSIGVPFENAWLEKIRAANPKMKIVPTDADIEKQPMIAHPEAASKEHHHEGMDPHIWLSPRRVKIVAANMLSALQKANPDHAAKFKTNYHAFIQEIDQVDQWLSSYFEHDRGKKFMVFHPSWGYFASDYGFEQIPVEVEGKSPKPAQLKHLIQKARQYQIRVVFAQPQFSAKSARLIAQEINGRIIFADPLALDWAANLTQVARQLKEALK